MDIIVKAFNATDNVELGDQFISGHRRVLEDFGITNVTTNTSTWKSDPNVIVIVAIEAKTNEMVGGVRIHRYSSEIDIPIIQALEPLDANIRDWVHKRESLGVGEGCGLWNAKKVYGKGISPLLTRCVVVLSSMVGVGCLIGLAAPYTREMAESMGFQIVGELGDGGLFDYPIETHRAAVLAIQDTSNLSNATELNRSRILSLRSNPNQSCEEVFTRGSLNVAYNLNLIVPV